MKTYKMCITVLLVLGVLLGAACVILRISSSGSGERQNTIHTEEQRVFDYADVLTEEEEQSLEELIKKQQKEACADIVLVTIDELSLQSDRAMREYAESFYDENDFGWNQAKGDGVIFADNWAEGADGKYCRLLTTGAAMTKISDDKAENIVSDICEKVNDNTYEAYRSYVTKTARAMKGSPVTSPVIPAAVALILTIIFAIYQFIFNKGKDTTPRSAYLDKEGIQVLNKQDFYLRSHVSRVKIEKDNHSHGGGGGGGGSSHGGAGGSH